MKHPVRAVLLLMAAIIVFGYGLVLAAVLAIRLFPEIFGLRPI